MKSTQLKQLNAGGYEVILVSFADLQNPHNDFDGKACGAVGQSSLMALYDTMFSQVKNKLHFLHCLPFPPPCSELWNWILWRVPFHT
ncbi:delta-1-pyrroline-5-carboxylate synthase [Quercus suber]|uniref:Delta-1-pyrroline-5-carboxylate synthase n=1 Tax=Quercus suber TaxID=58331 RepID=A0AAW0L084_QUESU